MQGIFRGLRHLALIAIIARAMLPMGWMPGIGADAPFIICSVDAPHAPDGKAPTQDVHHDACPFSAAPHLAAVPDLPQLALPGFHARLASADRAYAAQLAARFSPGSPRAPPAFA